MITGLRWQHKTCDLYLIYSCFWGGDYDENGSTIYVTPFLRYGNPLYVIFHELSHLLFWEYIYAAYSHSFIKRHHRKFWELSEIMVNYPLRKISFTSKFSVVVPPDLNGARRILKKFSRYNYLDIIKDEVKRWGRRSTLYCCIPVQT